MERRLRIATFSGTGHSERSLTVKHRRPPDLVDDINFVCTADFFIRQNCEMSVQIRPFRIWLVKS